MKKILLLFTIYCLPFTGAIFAYTGDDVSNATFLANKNLIVKQSSEIGYRLDDTITRAEVVGIALKMKGIVLPENYECRKYFSDVIKNDWVCRAIEIAADNGIVSRTNTRFRPQDTITKAEALSISMRSLNFLEEYDAYSSWIEMDSTTAWQKKVMFQASAKDFIDFENYGDETKNGKTYRVFSPNESAKRSYIFSAMKRMNEKMDHMKTGQYGLRCSSAIEIDGTSLHTWDISYETAPYSGEIQINSKEAQQVMKSGCIFIDSYTFFVPYILILDNKNLSEVENYVSYTNQPLLKILRNTVYARHGMKFTSPDIQAFFNSQSWYTINPDYSNNLLTEIDKKNIALIQKNETL